jgi:gliding motility-associated-like protein
LHLVYGTNITLFKNLLFRLLFLGILYHICISLNFRLNHLKHRIALKKNLRIIIGLLCLFNLSSIASNHYWVGGSGSWNDPSHWSAVSGGSGGLAVPGPSDHVYLDENSVGDAVLFITINGTAQCNNLSFSEYLGSTKLIGTVSDRLEVFGSMAFTEYVQNEFHGEIAFKGSGVKNIDFKYAMPLADVRFSGDNHSIWNLNSNLFLNFNSKIIMEGGQLNASGKKLQALAVQWLGSTFKTFNISNSEMVLAQSLDESGTAYSTVIKNNTIIHPRSSGPSRMIDSIQTVVVRPLCNNSADGSITATVFSSGTGPFTYQWDGSPSCSPIPCFGNPLNGVGAGSYLLTVTDVSDGDIVQQFVLVTAPNPIGSNFVRRRPKCFGNCNGSITSNVVVGSGTAPYTYLWNSSLPGFVPQNTSTAINLCAGTYTLTVTDNNGCTQNFTQILTQPAAIVPNASSTNLTCNGVCNGTATAAPTGGNAPFNYTYVWSSSLFPPPPVGQGTNSISALCAGTYTVLVTDDSTCTGTASVTITEPPALVITPSKTNITCNGACDGTATVAPVSGGTGAYTFVWVGTTGTFSGGGTSTITNVCPGTYTVTVSDANGCTRTSTFTITEPAPFTVTATGTNATCFNVCNGTVTATVAGGTSPFIYDWTPGPGATLPTASTTNTLNSQCDGIYTINVTDANNCPATASVTITEPPLLVANPVPTDVTCFGLCNGSVTSTPTGGTPPYTYAWTPNGPPPLTGQGTPTISALCPNTYTVVVTDALGCTSNQNATVTEPTQLTLSITKVDPTCSATCNGSATANVGGGNPGYTYSWTGPAPFVSQTTQTVSGLCPGTYTVVVTDSSGCTRTLTTTLVQPSTLSVTATSTTLDCNGDCDASAAATVTGGTPPYTFDWSGSEIGDNTSVISALCANGYTVTVTDFQGCIATASVNIFQPTVLNLTTTFTNVSCFNGCNGTAQALASGGTPGYSYLWSPGGFTTPNVTGLCAGTYTVCVTDGNGCVVCSTIVITEPNQLSGSPTLINNITCFGTNNGSVYSNTAGGVPPYTFNWTAGVTAAQGQGNDTLINLGPATYTLTVTDQNGCTSTQTIVVTQPPPFTATISSSTSSCNICNGSATVAVAGGSAPYTYLWAPAASGGTTPTATGLCPMTTYTVTVTDNNGCTATVSVTILQTVSITMTTSNTVLSCAGVCDGQAFANASGGVGPYSFIWAPAPVLQPGPPGFADSLCANITYSVTAVDANGCFGTDTVLFTNPPALDVTITSTNAICGGACNGTATANGSGGSGAYSYLWSDGQTTQTATGLCAGTYTVTITAGSCSDTASVIITEPPIIIDNPTFVDANCTQADGSISVAPTGGSGVYTSFVWTGPGAFAGQGTATITNAIAGAYTLTITDNAGCAVVFNYLLNNVAGPTLSMAHTNVSCNNACDGTAIVTASGGTSPYTFNWATTPAAVITGNGTNSVTNLCGTLTYTVTVTDNVGCITLDTATVINPTLMTPNPTVLNETCAGLCNGSISLNPNFGGTPPYTYLWSSSLPGPITGQGTSAITNLCPATYTVLITDNNGCTITLIRTITSASAIVVTMTSTNVTCNGLDDGTATASASGGSGGSYTYTWNPPVGVLATVVNLAPGSYTVTVGNGTGCTGTNSVTITEPVVLTATTSQTNTSCNSVCDGQAVVIPSGGTLPYSFAWSSPPGGTNDTLSSLCAGTYNITVTDGNGCTVSPAAVIITEPTVIVPNVTFTNPSCSGSCNGTAIANPTGGSGTYTYLWSPGGATTQSVSGLCAGSYTATVSSPAGCSVTQIITLIDNPVLIANPSSTSPSCFNGCNGSVTAAPVGGTGGGYTYSWNPGSFNTQTVTNLCPNTYTLVVTDGNACTDTQTVVMNNPAPVDIVVGSTPAACGVCDGTITVSPVTAGTYTYSWTRIMPALPVVVIPSVANPTGLCAGLYNVTVTNSFGCDSTFTIPLNNSGGPTGETVVTTDVTCNGMCNGSGTVTPIGGVVPYTYLWTDSVPTTVPSASNLCAGNYFVQVTDANSCIRFSPVTINEPPALNATSTVTSAVCSNVCTGTITLAVSGGTGTYTYDWQPAASIPTGLGTPAVSGLCAGSYTVTITDSLGCIFTDMFTVTQSAPLVATIGSTNLSCSNVCNGTTFVTITSGTPQYSIVWNNGQVNDTASALCAGTYSVTITDSLGCSVALNTTITSNPVLTASVNITDATCGVCDGSAVVTAGGGVTPYSYSWTNGDTTSNTSNLCAGLYMVVITDSVGCSSSLSVPVSNPTGPTSVAITSTNLTCNGVCTGAVTSVTPSGGTAPYSYLWIGNGLTTPTLSSLCAGVYYIQVTDSNSCSILDSVVITQPAPILANQTIVPPTCNASDGSITVAPTGGVGPYTYSWSPGGQVTPAITNQPGGLYTVQISDNAGCIVSTVIPLNSIGGPSLSLSATNISCNGVCDGTATVSASGGTSPYTYSWNSLPPQSTPVAINLCDGNYGVVVTGADGCISAGLISVTEPSPIAFSIANTVEPLCNGDLNGVITTIPSGGTLPYTYLWSSGGTSDTLSGIGSGSYTVTLTDNNGCTATQSVTLTEPAALTIASVLTNPTCNTINDGAINITVTGGTQPYTYNWNAGLAATEDLSGILSGTYTVVVTDANNCTISDTVDLLAIVTVIAQAGNDTTFCDLGSVTLNASASTNGTNFNWSLSGGGSVGSGSTITVNPPSGTTTYYVVVDNGSGCSDNDTITVTSTLLPVASAGNDTIVCQSGAITLDASGSTNAVTYEWHDMSGTLVGSSASVSVTPAGTTSYYVVVDNGVGCTDTDTINLILNPLPVADAGNDTSYCAGSPGSVVLNSGGSTNAVNVQWFEITAGSPINLGTTSTVTVSPAFGSTSYYVVVDNGAGCSDSDTVTISANQVPVANAGADITIIATASTVIGGSPTGPSGSTFIWNPIPGLDNATAANPVATPSVTTTYTVTVTTSQGCTDTDEIIVTVIPSIVIPDGISPNADGDNDEWIIDGIELFPNCNVEVYNRWGELLFQSAGYKEHWKGTYNGKDLPVGTYYYIIDLKDPLFPDVYTGPITILR